MSREIRFRVWDKESKKMIYREREDYDAIELLQFTGLKDINGVGIYEGDIVKVRTTDHEEDKFYMHFDGVVEFYNGSFNIKNPLMTYYRWTNYEVEVIGNIYENKNLLEEK